MNWRGWLIRRGWQYVRWETYERVTPTFMRCTSRLTLITPWQQLLYVLSKPWVAKEAKKLSNRIDRRHAEQSRG